MTSPFVRSITQTLRRLLLVAGCTLALGAQAQTTITMASTTSTEQSGLFGHLLPAFKKASGIDIKVVAVGTGKHWTWAAGATPMSCLSMTVWPNANSSKKVMVSSASPSCTTTLL